MSKYTQARQYAYGDMVVSKYFEKYKEILGDGNTARVIANSINSGFTSSANVDAIINLFKVIFAGQGFSEEEAIKYLNENKRLFELTYNQVLTVLALADTASLSEKAVFEKPGFIIRAHDLKKLYDSVRVSRSEGTTPTLERIVELENDDNREIQFKYDKSRVDMYKKLYKAKVVKKLKEQQEIKGPVLRKPEGTEE